MRCSSHHFSDAFAVDQYFLAPKPVNHRKCAKHKHNVNKLAWFTLAQSYEQFFQWTVQNQQKQQMTVLIFFLFISGQSLLIWRHLKTRRVAYQTTVVPGMQAEHLCCWYEANEATALLYTQTFSYCTNTRQRGGRATKNYILTTVPWSPCLHQNDLWTGPLCDPNWKLAMHPCNWLRLGIPPVFSIPWHSACDFSDFISCPCKIPVWWCACDFS